MRFIGPSQATNLSHINTPENTATQFLTGTTKSIELESGIQNNGDPGPKSSKNNTFIDYKTTNNFRETHTAS